MFITKNLRSCLTLALLAISFGPAAPAAAQCTALSWTSVSADAIRLRWYPITQPKDYRNREYMALSSTVAQELAVEVGDQVRVALEDELDGRKSMAVFTVVLIPQSSLPYVQV